MGRILLHWMWVTVALAVAAWLLPGVRIDSWPALLIGGLVLGFVNVMVRPILVFFTLPATIVTLGLFLFVVNGAAFALAAALTPGFEVASLWQAVLGALITSVVSWFLDRDPVEAAGSAT